MLTFKILHRFIYVETAFFWKWWQRQPDHRRHIVKRLVANGQLEFIGGAWSMHDEACTHYHSIVDQFTWGFRLAKESVKYQLGLEIKLSKLKLLTELLFSGTVEAILTTIFKYNKSTHSSLTPT